MGFAEDSHFDLFLQRSEVKDLTNPVLLGAQEGFRSGGLESTALSDLAGKTDLHEWGQDRGTIKSPVNIIQLQTARLGQ